MPGLNLDKYFLASIVESSRDSIITISLDLVITSWNKAAESLYGYSAEEAIGKRLTELTLPKDFQQLLLKVEKIKESKEVEVFESERVGKDKEHMILEVVVSPVKDETGEIIGLSTIARDLTARRVAEKALHDREILHRLIIAQEDERSRISRDLHDELGQQLIALRYAFERIRGMFGDEASQSHLSEMGQIVENIDKSVDFLAWELRPALLDSVGLPLAMDNYIRQWSSHSGVGAEFRAAPRVNVRFPPKIETNLYRIMQEALNNIHKHAMARSVQITLESRGDATVLIISDDGKGFNVRNKVKQSTGLGLTGMKERAALIGAELEIESSPRQGTTIYVKVAMSPKRKRRALPAQAGTNWGSATADPLNKAPGT